MANMHGCNQDITVWLRKKLPGTGQEVFERHVLPVKCRWTTRAERTVSNGVSNISTSAAVVIPYTGAIEKLKIKEGDMIALGVWDIDVTGISPYTAGEVKRLISPNAATVKSVALNSEKGAHLRLTGE